MSDNIELYFTFETLGPFCNLEIKLHRQNLCKHLQKMNIFFRQEASSVLKIVQFFFYFFYLASKQNKSDHPCLHCDKNSEHIPLKHDFICERLLTCGGINVQFFANLTIAVVSINPYPYECDTFRPNPFVLQSGAFRFAGLAVRTMMCCTSRLKSISVFIYSHCSKKLDSCNNEIILTRK